MTRLIDADALMPMMKYATTDSEIGVFPIKIGFNAIAKVIENAPTVDAEPVVRCKDCRFSDVANLKDRYGQSHPVPCCRAEGNFRMGITPDEYCSRAERKEE